MSNIYIRDMFKFALVLCLSGVVSLAGIGFFAANAQDNPPTVLITGSNRGMGFEFARQYAEKGWRVIATCRQPDQADALNTLAQNHPQVTVEQLDVTDLDRIDALAAKYEGQPIDVLINNAGIMGGFENQKFGQIKYELFDIVMHTNALGPLKMTEAFVENVAAGNHKKIVMVTSSAGSFTHPEINMGGRHIYRASKSAANMVMKSLSIELIRRDIILASLSPPFTLNDEIRKVAEETGRVIKGYEPEDSVAAMIDVIEGLTKEQNGSFLKWTGENEPW